MYILINNFVPCNNFAGRCTTFSDSFTTLHTVATTVTAYCGYYCYYILWLLLLLHTVATTVTTYCGYYCYYVLRLLLLLHTVPSSKSSKETLAKFTVHTWPWDILASRCNKHTIIQHFKTNYNITLWMNKLNKLQELKWKCLQKTKIFKFMLKTQIRINLLPWGCQNNT